ncbi:inositol 1,4,5-trisphosphate receptor-interacting protein-like 1 [Nyctibius grandis]|uniref:inositol 1,4,5-trisphosphate receptor-interacting protein-like 1 n=1 Tax=Nyctibius grandis TaxID=48427 RepID=UPI0035BC4E6D
MSATKFFAVLVQSIIQLPQMVGDEPDEATRKRVQHRAEQLRQEMTRLLRELQLWSLELRSLEQSAFAWGALLFAALQTWQFWAIAGILVLPFGLFRWLRKRSPEPESSSKGKESSSSLSKEEEEQEESEEGSDSERDMSRIFAKRIQWPVQNLANRIWVVEELLGELRVLQEPLSKSTCSFFPELQPAIRVGSAFEGWSPYEDDAVYRVLVPLKPPRGHAFHLELGTEQMPARNFCVRVEQVCTCTREQLVENMLCFLHHPEEELRRNQDPSFLRTLCTGSYLDVQKTARWFQSFVMSSWMLLPQSRRYKMKMLPSRHSCKMQLTKSSRRTLFIEIMFGVQQGDSDIFVSSQTREATFTPSTTWPESYAVAEVRFFRHVARQAPHSSYHLKCLHVCARILEGTGFSTYALKTAVMHLLTTIPLPDWHRREFLARLGDIMRYLRSCLEEKRLDHFFFGNERVPEEIILPSDFQTAEPINLFQHLTQDPHAHAEALREFEELQDRLTRLLYYSR